MRSSTLSSRIRSFVETTKLPTRAVVQSLFLSRALGELLSLALRICCVRKTLLFPLPKAQPVLRPIHLPEAQLVAQQVAQPALLPKAQLVAQPALPPKAQLVAQLVVQPALPPARPPKAQLVAQPALPPARPPKAQLEALPLCPPFPRLHPLQALPPANLLRLSMNSGTTMTQTTIP